MDKSIKDNNLESKMVLDSRLIALKAQKLTVAVYKITQYISDKEPLKWQLREMANQALLELAAVAPGSFLLYQNSPKASVLIFGLCQLCEVAKSAGGFSEMNFSILRDEYFSLKNELETGLKIELPSFKSNVLSGQISEADQQNLPIISQGHLKDKINPDKGQTRQSNLLVKFQARREAIIKFLRRRGSSEVAEIVKALPGIGEKTIQRNLKELIEAGKVRRFGQRRWSRYSLA